MTILQLENINNRQKKTIKVIESCTNLEHYKNANKYVELLKDYLYELLVGYNIFGKASDYSLYVKLRNELNYKLVVQKSKLNKNKSFNI